MFRIAQVVYACGAVLELFTTDPESYPDATVITQRQLEQLTDARTPQPVVALCRFIDVPFASVRSPRLVAICADVRDPGNAGTVIRCADAAGRTPSSSPATRSTPTTPRPSAPPSARCSTCRSSSSVTPPRPSAPRRTPA